MRRALLFSCLALSLPAAEDQDYLQPAPESHALWEASNAIETPRKSKNRAVAGDGATVTYTAFDGTVYSAMSEYRGKYTRLVLNQLWMTTTTEAQRLQFLDYADRVYSDYRKLVGVDPSGTAPLSIAMVTTCGYGCGYVGFKGIELDPGAGLRDDILYALAQNVHDPTLTHEFAHNFDVFHGYLAYWPDWGHAWTWMSNFLHFYTRQGKNTAPVAKQLRAERYATYDPYLANASLTWANCISGTGCADSQKNRIWAGLLLRYVELHGPVAVVRFMEFLRNYRAANPAPATNVLKEDLHLEAMAYGAQSNLACYADRWRWNASDALRSRMTAQYGANNPNCLDQDNDGFTPLDFDPDDLNPNSRPGGSELAANGRDDNGNGLVDETVYTESGDFAPNLPVTVPAAIRGSLSGINDGDSFTVTLAQPATLLFTLRSVGTMRGWIFLYRQDNSWLDYRYVGAGEGQTLQAALGAGTWRFDVALNSASTPGSYEVDIEAIPPAGPWATSSAVGNQLRLTAPQTSRYAQPPDNLEVWLGRYGVIRQMPWDGVSSVNVDVDASDAPGATQGTTLPYAFRATRQGLPVVDWTLYPAATLMTYAPPPLSILRPASGSTLTTSVVTFQWTPVTGATAYELRLIEANTPQQFRVTLTGGSTSAVYTIKSGSYRMELVACTSSGCGAPSASNFVVAAGTLPAAAPSGLSCQVVNDGGQNRLNCSWTAVAGANFYLINAVAPGAGPGGGALTVAGGQTGTPSASFLVPNGAVSVVVRACTGDGCGPLTTPVLVNASIGNPNVPVLGEPFGGSSFDSGSNAPRVFFSWNRVTGDNGGNFTYRLYVQDFSRNQPALDVLTANNFYAAYFNPGTRYDALVIAIPRDGSPQRQGPASPFLVRGTVPNAPVATEPTYGATVDPNAQGRIRVVWSPIVNADGTVALRKYQYFFSGPAQTGGVTNDNWVELPLAAGSWQGIMRACVTGTSCVESSNAGWGPWNNASGSQGGQASFIVR